MHDMLRWRVRYFTDGVALGTKEFVNTEITISQTECKKSSRLLCENRIYSETKHHENR
jgi:hypothetical protein